MNLSKFAKKLTVLGVSAFMMLGSVSPVNYQVNAEEPDDTRVTEGISWEKVDNSTFKGAEPVNKVEDGLTEANLIKDGNVRVSIVVDGTSTIEAGYSAQAVATDAGAQAYRAQVLNNQKALASKISSEALNGEALDVVWNITFAGNIISAYVPYAKINMIKNVAGVKDVVIETQYEAPVTERGTADDPDMAISTDMTGTSLIYSEYTGAGQAVAVIDTGLDIDHKSFDPEAFEYSIEQLDKEVDLLTQDEVAAILAQTNAYARYEGLSAADVYRSAKVPFAFNYVDNDLDIIHVNDTQGEHGSHVSGIAAGNKYVPDGEGGFAPALDAVKTQGQSPDAQLLVMKVFGKGGGAYDSDYFSAIEDAMILGAASANLSLGSGNAGAAVNPTYSDLLDHFREEDTVVTMSAGNSYAWQTNSTYGLLYSEDANFATGGSPGSYTNSFTVASINNDGVIGMPLKAGDANIFYSEGSSASNLPMTTIAGEQGYIAIDGFGTDEEMAALKDVLAGKIAVVSRGSTSFYQKANAAVANGAIATIVYNNQPGTINMNLTGYTGTAPAVSITQADGAVFKALGEAKTTEGGAAYYEGTMTVTGEYEVSKENADYLTMSDFSSWGTTGDLNLKPEITAPGGNIFSVYGTNQTPQGAIAGGTDQYELMSGTSMAAPQISGLDAVFHQYIEENDLVAKTGLTERQLTISLLMSTAEPVIQSDTDYYYSVLKQGAGLVNVAAATSAKSFVTVDGTTVGGKVVEKAAYTTSYADGKVKAMFGEDADRTGLYTVTYKVTNFSDEEVVYGFDSDVFTQDVFPYGDMEFLDEWTLPLKAIVTYTINGEPLQADGLDFDGNGYYDAYDAQALLEYVVGTRKEISHEDKADIDEDGDVDTYDAYLALNPYNSATIKAKAGETVTVTATIDLNGSLDELGNEDRNGAYVEGYLAVVEGTTAEGVIGVKHTIPMLGYFGSWSEPDMFDKGSRLEYAYGEETRAPYMYAALNQGATNVESFGVSYAGINGTFYFGGNPYGTDKTYHPERNAINSRDTVSNVMYSQIRNAGAGIFLVTDKNGEILAQRDFGATYAAYYYVNGAEWRNPTTNTSLGYQPKDVAEGTELTFTYAMMPEYYVENGEVHWDAYKGTPMRLSATVDNTAPELVGDEPVALIKDENDAVTNIEFTVKDNRYVAIVYLCDENDNLIGTFNADEDAVEGAEKTYSFDLTEIENVPPHLYLQICDYAANETYYKINLNEEELAGDLGITVTPAEINVLKNSTAKATATVTPWGVDDRVVWSIADESIATVDEDGIITGVEEGTTTVTATSAIDETVSGTATVVVKTFDIELNGIVWDENGEVWFSEFNTNSLPDYTKLSGSMRLPLASAAYDQNGTLYAATLDSSDLSTSLYTIDEETYTATEIGASEIGYMDICKAPSLGENILLGVYGPYAVIIDATTGDYIGVFDLSSFTGGANLVGIAYEEQYMHEEYGASDIIFLMDDAGVLYETGVLALDGGYSRYGVTRMGQIADSVDTPYFQSLYYDGTNLFFSRFKEADNKVELVMVEDLYNVGNIWSVGYFADGVWPVGGLYEKGVYDVGMPVEDPEGKTFEVEASSTMDIEKLVSAGTAAKGSLNVAVEAEMSGDIRESAELNGAGASDSTLVTVTTDTDATNGLYTVTYNPEEVEYIGTKGTVRYSAVNDEEEGKIVFGFINPEALDAESVVANISFKAKDPSALSDVEVKTEEENNEKSENTATAEIGGSALVINGEVIKVRLTGDDWGAGIDKAIVKLNQKVDGAYVTGGLFEVTQAVNGGEAKTRTVLDAYASDEEGNPVTSESEYITLDLRISPVEGSPIVWSMQTWTNSWADPYELKVNLKDGAKLFTADGTVTALSIDGVIDVKDPENEKVMIPQLEGYEYSTFTASDGLEIPYGLYTPENADDGSKHALVIWNHGVGERGSDPRIAILGNEVSALNGEEFQKLFGGAYVLVPQTPADTGDKDIITGKIELIEAMIADENLNVDEDRVIVGGCSMGGGQTMSIILKAPQLFAAAYPVCPHCPSENVTDEQIKRISRLPIWFIHCTNDGTVKYPETTELLIERLQAAGNTNVHWSLFEDVHDTTGRFNDLTEDGSDYKYNEHWSWVYFDNNECFCDDENCGDLNCWQWLAEQVRVPFEFDDVKDPEKYYYDPVYWAYYHDPQITKGTSDTLFTPEGTCSRAQIVTFLWRMIGEPEVEYDMEFTDVTEDRYFYKAVAWAASEGITTGTSKTKFSPDEGCTRAQIVTFLWRAMDEPEPETTAEFEDVTADRYFAKAVSWAAENNITKGTSATKFSPDVKCTRAQAVTFLYRTAQLGE